MEKNNTLLVKEHPDYEATIDDVVHKKIDQKLMDEATRRTKRESRAEALYVLLKLKESK